LPLNGCRTTPIYLNVTPVGAFQVRARTYAILTVIALGAAGYFALPYSPVPDYLHAFTARVSALTGFGADRIRSRVLPDMEKRLSQAGIAVGAPVYLRVFTAEQKLQVWLRGDTRYNEIQDASFCTDTDGDANAAPQMPPPGVYRIRRDDLSPNSPSHVELGLNPLPDDDAPTPDDAVAAISYSLHGNCSNLAGISLKNDDIEQIYLLVDTALRAGQQFVPVHVFETAKNMDDSQALTNDAIGNTPAPGLYDVYAAFERTHIPPDVSKSNGRYHVAPAN
jgi:murein L,D-transpeptidase YafK